MSARISFTKKDYERIRRIERNGEYGKTSDYVGHFEIGAVRAEFVILEDDLFTKAENVFGNKFALNVGFYVLGEDNGYGKTPKGTPYSYFGGFYGKVKGSYSATRDELISSINKFITQNEKLKAAAARTDICWD